MFVGHYGLKKVRRILVFISLIITNYFFSQSIDTKSRAGLSKFYFVGETGISTNQSKLVTSSTNVKTEIKYTSRSLKKVCMNFGIGLKTKSNLVYEISMFRASAGTDLIVKNIFDSVLGGDIPIQVSQYYNIWSCLLSLGYNLEIGNFTCRPSFGIGKPFNRSSESGGEAMMKVDRWSVNIIYNSKFVNTAIYSTHFKLPIGYSFKRKAKPFIDVCYSPSISFSNKDFIFTTMNFKADKTDYVFNFSNNGNYIAHALSITYWFNGKQ